MVAVHDGTANINKRSVINVKCVNCKNCIDTITECGTIYYVCMITDEVDYIEECVANDENLGCEFYEQDCNDDFTA